MARTPCSQCRGQVSIPGKGTRSRKSQLRICIPKLKNKELKTDPATHKNSRKKAADAKCYLNRALKKEEVVTNINQSKNISQVGFSDKGFQVKFPNKTSYKTELSDFHRSLDFRITNAGLQVYNKIK